MHHGKYEARHLTRERRSGRKAATLVLSLLLLIVVAIGGTLAYLSTKSESVENTFTPSAVDCEVNESFNGAIKSNVNVKNTGDTEAYIRVKLVSYRVNDQGQHIGGVAEISAFELGENWVKHGEYYYYTLPVNPGEMPAANLTNSIQLTSSYDDADGGKQVIEVMAEAIQSVPEEAVGTSWGVSISSGSVTDYNG